MEKVYKSFKKSVKEVTDYYLLLVEETQKGNLVGSTNEWVLDNYYIISEQEKVMRGELSRKALRQIGVRRVEMLRELCHNFLQRGQYKLDKELLIRYLRQVQAKSKDYLTYAEVCLLVPLLKQQLLEQLAQTCRKLRERGAQHYSPTEKAEMATIQLRSQENLLMSNLFTSIKELTKTPIAEIIDGVSLTEHLLKKEQAGMYDKMYDKTKEDYRARLVRLAKKEKMSEYALAKQLVEEADQKKEHVGWRLFSYPPQRWERRAKSYIAIVAAATAGLALLIAWLATHKSPGVGHWVLCVCAVLMLVPMSQLVIDLLNRVLYKLHKPVNTFKIKFKDGLIPEKYATMVIMPTILKNKSKTEELFNQLEVYYLSNINRGTASRQDGLPAETGGHGAQMDSRRLDSRGQNIFYTLIGDAAAASEEDMPWDEEVVEAGLAKVRELNEKYGAEIFNFVYRRRAYSEGEGCWLGHERKRGAILDFNDLLLGSLTQEERQRKFRCETITASCHGSGEGMGMIPPITFVITLDTDTQLVLYSAQKLIGAMAHPLNRARLSADGERVEGGYGIMQPRVNVDVEVTDKSRYAQLFAGLGGLDVYTTASFELYQDIFNEGSFCGKGIYDLHIFQKVLRGRFPENLILSHDLIEGCHIRCGLINDVELYDDNPSNYLDDAKRHHRWTRGDWQIISWLKSTVRNEAGEKVKNQVNTIGRWKIFDNLRRSVLSTSLLVAILFGFICSTTTSGYASPAWYVLAALIVTASPILFFLWDQITHLPRIGKRYRYYMTLLRGMAVVAYRSLVQFALLPKEAWMYTDAIVRSCYRMRFSHKNLLNWVPSDEASKSTKGTLADYVQKFWFNYLCAAVVAVLTDLALNNRSQLAVGDCFTVLAAVFTCAAWLAAPFLMYHLGKKFPQDRHTLNNQQTDEVRQWAKDTWNYFDTLITEENNYLVPDNYQLTRDVKSDYKTSPTNIGYSLTAIISAADLGFITHHQAVKRLGLILNTVAKLEKWNGHLFNWYHIVTLKALPNFFISTCDSGNFVACLYVVKSYLSAHPDIDQSSALNASVQRLIDNTDFSKLYNPRLDVFAIGYDHGSQSLLPYHYNNYASEARLTSFLSIAQGDAPYKHWFCLDKTLVQYKGYKGVASWYGTLFEYLMPLIFLPTYRHTLMDETYSFAIRAQRAYAHQIGNTPNGSLSSQFTAHSSHKKAIPWGISETAYNELDDAQNYKYQAFGIPYLKFQNTTPDRVVLSPYSSLMAISIDDKAVYQNMQQFLQLGMYDHMGFFESYDNQDHLPILAHYAHHQGMILAALSNYLCHGNIQNYFINHPLMRSMQTLLKEKAQIKPYIDLRITQYKRLQYNKELAENDLRDFDSIAPVPEIGILSNGRYTVLLNDRGSGFSRYRNTFLNRYRQVSADHYGTYLFIRNLRNDSLWSATFAPLDVQPPSYRVTFASDKVTFLRSDHHIETKTEVTVLKDRNAEIRRYTFSNNTSHDIDLELTSYSEAILSTHEADESHRLFNSMAIASHFDHQHQMLILDRPAPNQDGSRCFLMHKLFQPLDDSKLRRFEDIETRRSDGERVLDRPIVNPQPEYETSRLAFLGRGGSLQHAEILESRRSLSGTIGTTLDPITSMRIRLHIPAGQKGSACLLIGFGRGRKQLDAIADALLSPSDIDLAFQSASVYSNMLSASLRLKGAQMRLYNSIAKHLLQNAAAGTDRQVALAQNQLAQPALWRFGISGDLPILLLEINNLRLSGHAKELLRAFEYYKVHGLALDLVFINDEQGDSRDALALFINSLANTEHLWVAHEAAGRVYVINGSDLSPQERTLLRTVAKLRFDTLDGSRLEQQLARLEAQGLHYHDKSEPPRPHDQAPRVWSSLKFYNQYGGFDHDGRDYVVTNTNTPMPWVNILANPHFGCVISASMSGFTFAHNAQQFKLTAWSNDMVRDTPSETLLINGRQFLPATARHSQGFSSFDAAYDDMQVMVRVFVSHDKPEKYYQIKIANTSDSPLDLQLDLLCSLVLGLHEEQTAPYLLTQWDPLHNSLSIRNTYHQTYPNTRLHLSATHPLTTLSLDTPNRKSVGFRLSVEPHASSEAAFVLSVSDHLDDIPRPITLPIIEQEFLNSQHFWQHKLSAIQVSTPDPAFNYMANHWYLYQVYASRLYARAGFYQVGGATGFRDQLQDVMALLYSDPDYARRQILDHAAHQFPEGDVLHWWHETLHLGARTTFSDDYLWLIYVSHQYVSVTQDWDILLAPVPYCKAESLAPGEAERCLHYEADAQHTEPLIDHLRRAISRAQSRIGRHGLPLIGCGDWNDGLSSVGTQGQGESVWVALFLVDIIDKFLQLEDGLVRNTDPHATPNGDSPLNPSQQPAPTTDHAATLRFKQQLISALQDNAWDGAWFLRAYYDNGDPIGSRNNSQCQIDLITQAWSILTDVATPEQKAAILREADARLVDRQNGIIRLLTPPFQPADSDGSTPNYDSDSSHAWPQQDTAADSVQRPHNSPGYIIRYPVGVRENGGQYTHGALWYIIALIKEHRTDYAYYLFSLINPVQRTTTLADTLKYKVEPYCIAADIYSHPQHPGRGGWTWYTGSASWAYKVAIENILGFHLSGNQLTISPNIPSTWDTFSISYRYHSSTYHLTFRKGLSPQTSHITLIDDHQDHHITL